MKYQVGVKGKRQGIDSTYWLLVDAMTSEEAAKLAIREAPIENPVVFSTMKLEPYETSAPF